MDIKNMILQEKAIIRVIKAEKCYLKMLKKHNAGKTIRVKEKEKFDKLFDAVPEVYKGYLEWELSSRFRYETKQAELSKNVDKKRK